MQYNIASIYTLANHSTEVPREEQPAAQPERQMCKYEWFETSIELHRFWKFKFITECNITLLPFVL